MTVGGEKTLQESLEEVRDSLKAVGKQLEKLERKDRTNKILFSIAALVIAGMIAMGFWGFNAARQAREDLATKFEVTTINQCENSQESRVGLRGVFHIFLQLAEERSDDPQAVREFTEVFNEQLMDALPDRDCEQEARDRERLSE